MWDMAFKKAFDQTFRELKREVNKFRLPEIEVKVHEATSNEPWGPHGSLMTEIADASVDPNEVQLIMGVFQKRLVDTGKNWRHVYKSLTVMEFLIANGSSHMVENIIAYMPQLVPLNEFQYIEQPSGKDQGINVRKKAETLIALLSDRQRINDVRKKATANKNKYQGVGSSPSLEQQSGRLEDDDWQKPMQTGSFRQPNNVQVVRGPPPSYEEAMRSSLPVDPPSQPVDDFDPRGVPPPSCTDCGASSSGLNNQFQMNPVAFVAQTSTSDTFQTNHSSPGFGNQYPMMMNSSGLGSQVPMTMDPAGFGNQYPMTMDPAAFGNQYPMTQPITETENPYPLTQQFSSTNPSASTITNFAQPASAQEFPPLQGSSDKLDVFRPAGTTSFRPPHH